MDNFISGEKIQSICDCSFFTKDYIASFPSMLSYCKKYIIIDDVIGIDQINIIKNSYSFFIKPDWLELLVFKIMPFIQKNFVLVTHNSDLSVGPISDLNHYILSNPFLVTWYGQNMIPYDKCLGIPIGLENSHWGRTNYSWCLSNKDNIKNNLLYFQFNTFTNSIRETARRSLLNNGFIENSVRDWKDYIRELSTYQFCISPPGNGIDCHRHWEAIYVGCIPIVLRTAGDNEGFIKCPKDTLQNLDSFPRIGKANSEKNDSIYYYFKDLPILFVDDYSIVTKEFLEEQLVRFKNKRFDMDVIRLEYWIENLRFHEL